MARPSAEFTVELRSVSKRFGDGPLVLEDVSITVRRGEFISLIGPSGCGKSTLLRVIAGLTPLTSGSLTLSNPSPTTAAPKLSFVFQEPTLLPWLSAQRNVEVPLRLRGVPARECSRLSLSMLSQVRLADRARAFPRQLSGGQKMRVSLARALVETPDLLLLDEPFGALDEMTRDHLNEELLSLREQQAWTAFFVTHSVAEAIFLSSRVIVLSANPGRIHAEFQVPFAYPRTEETRRTASFHQLALEVSRTLRSVEENAGTHQ